MVQAYGAADFASLLRTGGVLCAMNKHTASMRYTQAALDSLQQGAAEQEAAGKPLPAAYHAHLAVAYHNYATQLARGKMLYEASAAIKIAHQLAAQVLPTKHRWARAIHASEQLLRDIHLATSFVTHSLRPRASDNVRLARERDHSAAEAEGQSGPSRAKALSNSQSLPALRPRE